jgi:hypothetical protein
MRLSPAGEVLAWKCGAAWRSKAAKSAFDEGVKTLEAFTAAHVPKRQFEEL